MDIKDLEQSHELSGAEQAAVHGRTGMGGGAMNGAFLIGNGSQVVGGPSLINVNASPTTVVQNAFDNDTFVKVDIDSTVSNAVANMTASIGEIGQKL